MMLDLPTPSLILDLGTTNRFAKAMSDYGAGVLAHVVDSCTDKVLTPEDMLATRQLSAGASPIFPLVEYSNDLHLPDYVFDDPIIQRLAQLVTDFVVMLDIPPFVPNNTAAF